MDEQYSAVGIITRIEALLNSISHRLPVELPKNFNILDVKMKKANIKSKPDKNKKLYLPDLGIYRWFLSAYFEKCGYKVGYLNEFSRELLMKGRAETNLKKLEYEAETFRRAPLSEMMWFLWKDCGSNGKAAFLLVLLRIRIDRRDKKRVWLCCKEKSMCMIKWILTNTYKKGDCKYAIY